MIACSSKVVQRTKNHAFQGGYYILQTLSRDNQNYSDPRMNGNRVFPKIDHSGNSTRIVLKQNKFGKKVTSNRDWSWDTGSLVALLLQSHAFPTELSWQVIIEKYLTPLLFVHQLTSLLAMIALSVVQSYAQSFIYNAILFIDTSNNAWYNQADWLIRIPYLSIIASNAGFRGFPALFTKPLASRLLAILWFCLVLFHHSAIPSLMLWMGLVVWMVSEVIPTASRMLDSGFVNRAIAEINRAWLYKAF